MVQRKASLWVTEETKPNICENSENDIQAVSLQEKIENRSWVRLASF